MTFVPLAGIAETTLPSVLVVLSLVGVGFLSFADANSTRQFLEDYGVLFVVAGFAAAAVVGVALYFVGDETLAKEWLDQYGLLALFLILILEGAMLLYFAPSESLAPAAVTILASPNDYGAIAAIIFVATVGATIGQYVLFSIAKRGGREYLLEKPWFRISESKLNRFDGWFQRWGRLVVPVSNALLFTRGMLTVPAGFAEMRDWEFVVLSAIGTIIFQSWLVAVWIYAVELGFLEFI